MKNRGLKKYCDEEEYIIEIFKNKKEIFEEIVGSNIKDIYSKVRFNENKVRVDLTCKLEEGSLLFVEVSIRDNCVQDFVTHKRQLINILNIIGKDNFAQIILMSPNFLNEDINDLVELIASYNVKLYFVYIPMELILKVKNHINVSINEKKRFIYNKSTVDKCIKVISKTLNTNKMFIYPLINEQCGNAISKAILKGLREEIYWHLAVHRYKDLSKNIIRIGTGTSDIILNIHCNMADKIRVEVDFAQRLNVFNIFKNYMADMSSEIGSSIDIAPNSPKIFTEIPMLENEKITISTTINTAKRYIEYITKMYKEFGSKII